MFSEVMLMRTIIGRQDEPGLLGSVSLDGRLDLEFRLRFRNGTACRQ